MLVCSVSMRAPQRAIFVELAEIATADDASTTGTVVFATLVDDPASVNDIVDAYLGEIMLEAASASDIFDVGFAYGATIGEAATAADVPDAALGAASTTWSPTDNTGVYTLTNANLTARTGTGGNHGIRSTAGATSGKIYFEQTLVGAASGGYGIITPTGSLSSAAGNAASAALYFGSGPIWYNSGPSGVNIGAASVGQVVCTAVDLTNRRIWFRINSGNWNGNASFDPAANTGGIDISALFTSAAAFVALTTSSGSGTPGTTLNVGATSFAFTVPSGFAGGP